ncbi:ABC transporter substrate-binding protein [Trebonia sp.]|jgi:branched-chain amino acid transport system substrate-binding protein|uniref:ABC transporter substrate-binding protein n=1 Tax=Trebonia sp. TaxID=2767075 RepID=UPI003BB15A32
MDDTRVTSTHLSRRLRVLGSAAAGAVLAAGLAAGCSSGGGGSSSAASGTPLTVCEIAATSGPFAQLGDNDELGATAWAAMVNKAGGVLGHKITLVQENDASDPATAAALVRKCVTQVHANFIFGPEETATASAAVPIANQLKEVTLGWQSGWAGQGISAANLTSYAFPGIGNVFFADDLATVTQLIVPRHYTRVAVIEDNAPGGLGNTQYVQSLASQNGYSVVASQITNPGATDDTPQVLNLLKANPQIIVLGLIPGPDTITFIKAVRAQNPTIPISECSGCATSTFVNAVGGATAMQDVYMIGTPENVLSAIPSNSTSAPALADTRAYIAAMKAAGLGSANDISEGGEGWDTGRELTAAIESAKSTSPDAVKNALAHQALVTGGIQAYYWQRSPSNYANITQIYSAVVTVGADGSFNVLPHVGN